MTRVENSLSLNDIIASVKLDNREIWYVSRTGTVKRFTILTKLASHNYVRNHPIEVDIYTLNNEKHDTKEWLSMTGSGEFFDQCYKSGHFFYNQAHAFAYLRKRVEIGNGTMVKTAKPLLEQFPEYNL